MSGDVPEMDYDLRRRLQGRPVDEPCSKCGRSDLPLHVNRQCPECYPLDADGTPAPMPGQGVLAL